MKWLGLWNLCSDKAEFKKIYNFKLSENLVCSKLVKTGCQNWPKKKKINVHDLHIAVKALHIIINSYFMLVQIMQSAWKLIFKVHK